MNVVAHQHGDWFLLEEAGSLFFDVNCSYSAVSFSMLIQLTEIEAEQFRKSGTQFLDELAASVQEHALSKYHSRNLPPEWHTKVTEAIAVWRSTSTGPK